MAVKFLFLNSKHAWVKISADGILSILHFFPENGIRHCMRIVRDNLHEMSKLIFFFFK